MKCVIIAQYNSISTSWSWIAVGRTDNSGSHLRTHTNGDSAIFNTGLPRSLGGVHIPDRHKSSVNPGWTCMGKILWFKPESDTITAANLALAITVTQGNNMCQSYDHISLEERLGERFHLSTGKKEKPILVRIYYFGHVKPDWGWTMRLGVSVTLPTQNHLVLLPWIILYCWGSHHLNPSLTSPRASGNSGQGSLLWGWVLLEAVRKFSKTGKTISRWRSYYLRVPPFNQRVTAPSLLMEVTSVLVLLGKCCCAQVSGLKGASQAER